MISKLGIVYICVMFTNIGLHLITLIILTLILKVPNKVALGTKAVDNFFRFVNLNSRSLYSKLWVCVNHLGSLTVFLQILKFKLFK